MTWREYFKDSGLTKVPQEFLDKEIIVDDCLQMICMMSFTIKELLDKTKWHTGTPAEEGDYLIAFHPWGRKENGICYMGLEWKDGHYFDHVNDYETEPYLVAWKKIEPYKESE